VGTPTAFSGPTAAMLTLYQEDGAVDADAMARYCHWLLQQGCTGLLMFGTTGEGPSLSVAERQATLRAVIQQGVPAERIVVGAVCTALPDTVALTRTAGELGCAGALVLPPFYFRSAPADGVLAFMSTLLAQTGSPILLYHFPDMSGVTLTHEMVGALMRSHEGRMLGVKDSSGRLDSIAGWAQAFPDLLVFSGDDDLLRPGMQRGAAGVMTATCAFAPALVATVQAEARERLDATPKDEARLNDLWRLILNSPSVGDTIKMLFAHFTGDQRWSRTRAPLAPVAGEVAAKIRDGIAALDRGSISGPIRSMPRIFADR